MKNFTKYICLFLLFLGTSIQTYGDSWTWTAASGDNALFGTKFTTSGKIVLNGKNWSFTRTDAGQTLQDNTSCVQFGKGSYPETVVLSTRAFNGTITQIDVACASASAKHTCKIEVGGTTVKAATNTSSWTTVGTISTSTISASGNVVITFTPTSGAGALYIKSISITYTPTTYNVDWYVGDTKEKSETSVAIGTPPSVADNALGGDCSTLKFLGWSETDLGGTPTSVPNDLFQSDDLPGLTKNTTYHAVFGEMTYNTSDTMIIQDHQYDSWSYGGSTTNKSGYRAFHNTGYVQSASFDLSGLAEVIVNGGTLGGDSYNSLTIGDGTNTWKNVTVSGASQTGLNYYTGGTALSGKGTLKVTSKSGSATSTGVRMTRVRIFTFVPQYSNCVTTCVTCADEPSVGDAELESITAGTISVSCDAITNDDGCATEEYGFVWKSGASAPSSTSDGTKVKVGDDESGDSGFSEDLSISFTTGTTYQIVTYATNGAGTTLGEAVAVTPQSITFNSNGGSSVSTIYVQSGTAASAPTAPTKDGYVFGGWYQEVGLSNEVNWSATISADKTYYAKWRPYVDYRFSCAELTLTPVLATSGTPIFITSTAGKKVRSQDYITISGNGLATGATISFPDLDSKFEIKTSTGAALPAVDANGEINVNAYIFYTPAVGSTTDGLDKLTGLIVSVGGAKPITKKLTQDIIGRHLPANFVIAAKRNNKWYAMPDTMTVLGTPKPIEIAVDDIDNPSIAYTASTTLYGLESPTSSNVSGGNGQYVRFTMTSLDADANPEHGHAPLFGSTTGTPKIGKSSTAQATSNLSAGYWWKLIQKNTDITNPQDAKYQIFCANNDTTLSLKENAGNPIWGLYKSGIDELRLIPASSTPFTEGEIVEWGQHKAIVEVYPYSGGNYANTVDASINGITKTGLAVSQTLTSVKSGATKYNYTIDFTSDIDFSTLAGKTLLLEWKYNGTSIGACSMVVPRIIATSSTMSVIESRDNYWTSQKGPSDDVHVLPGVILTADAGSFASSDVTIKNLEIYPGATVKVTTGTLDVTNLVFRNGWSRAGEKFFDVSRMYIADDANLTHTNAYADWYIDFDRWYPIAVPWPVTVSGISYKNSNASITVGPIGRVRLQYYDGAKRATGSGTGSNWQKYGEDGKLSVPTTLVPSQGYSITAQRPTGKAFSIVRMPLTFANVWTTDGEQGSVEVEAVTTKKNEVSVTAHGKNSDKPWYTKCWNFVANPYMAAYNANESGITGKVLEENGSTVKYATILDPTTDDYDQIVLNDGEKTVGLKPQSGFFVQVKETGTLTFSQNKIIAPTAPARYTNETDAIPEQEAYIRLSGENSADQMGLIIGADYTANYEINADLSKILGEANTLKTYLHYTDMDFAYLAINEQLASEEIPVTVKIPVAGEYTYSLRNSSTVDQLEGLYLIDHLTNTTTNLIYDDYTFTSTTEGTIGNRFAINAVVGERQVPTEVDISGADKDGTAAVKFIWHDKVYVLHNNVIYDSTGKRVYEINK